MKDLFPGHFKESEEHLRKTWDTSLFVFDANILLNLYRYSDTTRNEFLRILEKIKDRAWLPHRAAEEYLNNRLSVIDQQEKSYDDTVKSIELLKKDLENSRQHPFVSKKIMTRASKVFEELCNELKSNKSIHTTRINDDEIKDSIANIFKGCVGFPYGDDQLKGLIVEGEERYKQKIPPGFKDSSKSGDSEIFTEKCRKYGDLIVWKQVIDKAVDEKKGVILVTDDKKEDWWERFKGRTVGPRPELAKEFKDITNQTFHMYQADRFLELARENLDEQVSEEIVREIREVRLRDKALQTRLKEKESFKKRKSKISYLSEQVLCIREIMTSCNRERLTLQKKLSELNLELRTLRERKDYLASEDKYSLNEDVFMSRYESIFEERAEVEKSLENKTAEWEDLKMQLMNLEDKISQRRKVLGHEGTDSFTISNYWLNA